MIERIMRHIRNYFPSVYMDGSFEIKNGILALENVIDGQYIKIEGSKVNNGVYKYPVNTLTNETFNGCVVILNPPKAFLDVCEEIEAYTEKNAASPYVNESFGGYSYTKATNGKGGIASWQDIFKSELDAWRKI